MSDPDIRKQTPQAKTLVWLRIKELLSKLDTDIPLQQTSIIAYAQAYYESVSGSEKDEIEASKVRMREYGEKITETLRKNALRIVDRELEPARMLGTIAERDKGDIEWRRKFLADSIRHTLRMDLEKLVNDPNKSPSLSDEVKDKVIAYGQECFESNGHASPLLNILEKQIRSALGDTVADEWLLAARTKAPQNKAAMTF